MRTNKTIEPDTQEAILKALPDDYDLAMELICQLLSNMMLSGKEPWNINKVNTALREYLTAYEDT